MVNKPEALCRLDAQRKIEIERRNNLAEVYASHLRALAPRLSRLHQSILSGPEASRMTGGDSRKDTENSDDSQSTFESSAIRAINNSVRDLLSVDRLSPIRLGYNYYFPREYQAHTLQSTLEGHTIASDLPQILYTQLNTGYIFECHVSATESDSYISYELFLQIRNRPAVEPSRSADRLRFNGDYYSNLGFVTFTMKMSYASNSDDHSTIEDESSKTIDRVVTAAVVPNLFPDMFLGISRNRASRHR